MTAAGSGFAADPARYDSMPYRQTGRSGLKLPAISLGLWHNFGDGSAFESQRAIIRHAFDQGLTHFDLANNYGPPYGAAESNFGRLIATDLRAYRDEIVVSTKAGYDMWSGPYGDGGSRKYLLASLDASLRRLGLDYVDIFYSHRPDPQTPIEETASALATAVSSGRALYVGVSNYDADQTEAVAAALDRCGVPLLINQPRYSMFDRTVEVGLLDAADQLGIGLIAFSPLAQGLLSERYLDGIPRDSRAATSRFLPAERVTDSYRERAAGLAAIAAARGQSLAQMAISWVLRRDTVTSALVGASSVAQLDDSLAALNAAPFDSREIQEIDRFAIHGTGLAAPA